MKFTRNTGLVLLALVGVSFLIFRDKQQDIDSIDLQLSNAQREANERYLSAGTESPLSNTNSTLSTIVAQNSSLKNELATLRETVNTQYNLIERLQRQQDKPDNVGNSNFDQKFNNIDQQLSQLKTDIENKLNNNNFTVSDITGDDIQPIEIPLQNENLGSNENSLIGKLVQPDTASAAEVGPNPIKSNSSSMIKDSRVLITQSDVKFEQDKEGNVVKIYPDIKSKNIDTVKISDTGNTATSQTSSPPEKPAPVPIYTIPSTATLFGSVSMSAIIGRVPINNAVSNPFRFKVLVGNANLATNGIYIPNLEDMVLSGFAEGDFTMECARGNIDTATFTFKDGTIKTVKGTIDKPIGWLSDASGVPCIAGQYITNFPSYAAKQGGLKMLSAFASSIAGSAVTTTTSTDGVTKSVVNDSTKNALGDGFQGGADEITKWYAERQGSAFDAVYVGPGEKVVVNIEEELRIDYEIDGRKTVHSNNIQEYAAW